MSDPISRWMNDLDGPPLSQWTANRFYRRALDARITDPVMVANALLLLDAVEKSAKRNPNVPYDALVETVLAGLDPESSCLFPTATRLLVWKIQLRRWGRRVWRLYCEPIKQMLSKR